MRQAGEARARMQALLGIATEDLMRIAEGGAAPPRKARKRSA